MINLDYMVNSGNIRNIESIKDNLYMNSFYYIFVKIILKKGSRFDKG